ncbi:hypothetical protein ACFL0V_00285 [Nanoarchaeota archaeon]
MVEKMSKSYSPEVLLQDYDTLVREEGVTDQAKMDVASAMRAQIMYSNGTNGAQNPRLLINERSNRLLELLDAIAIMQLTMKTQPDLLPKLPEDYQKVWAEYETLRQQTN